MFSPCYLLNFPITALNQNIWRKHFNELKRKGSINIESIQKRKDGTVFPTAITANYVKFEGKEYNFAFVRDITEQKNAEEALKESQKQFESLVSNIPGVTYRCALDEHRTMFFISDAVLELTGYPASDFINNFLRTFESIIHPDDSPFVDRSVNDAIKLENPWEIEYRVCHKDGSIRWVYEKGRGVKSKSNNSCY